MKAAVYYFSGTGNSLAVAVDIAKELGGELIPIPSVMDKPIFLTETEIIGIVFPVYIFGLPLIVERFIRKIGNLGGKYIFAIATYGGMPGATINQLAKVIDSCGGKLAAGFGVPMPGNYTPMYGALAEEKQGKMFAKWQNRVKEISETVQARREGIRENSNFLVNYFFSHLIYRMAAPHIPEMDKAFYVDEKCTRCGVCAKVCPVKNIELSDGKPVWKGTCEQCLACLHWCPVEAIQSGKNTSKRKRYHHPDAKVADFLTQDQ